MQLYPPARWATLGSRCGTLQLRCLLGLIYLAAQHLPAFLCRPPFRPHCRPHQLCSLSVRGRPLWAICQAAWSSGFWALLELRRPLPVPGRIALACLRHCGPAELGDRAPTCRTMAHGEPLATFSSPKVTVLGALLLLRLSSHFLLLVILLGRAHSAPTLPLRAEQGTVVVPVPGQRGASTLLQRAISLCVPRWDLPAQRLLARPWVVIRGCSHCPGLMAFIIPTGVPLCESRPPRFAP